MTDFIRLDGRRVEIRRIPAREPAPPTLVFLHEGLGSVGLWRDFPDRAAAATGAGALVWSRFGHGRSDPPPGPRDVDYLHREALDILPAVLEAEGIAAPVLIGHSDGASIALIHASERPVRGVAVMAPHSWVEPLTLAGIRDAVRMAGTSDLLARLSRHHDDAPALFRAWSGIWLSEPFARWSIEALLPAVTAPVLAIQGEEDEYGTAEQIRRVARLVSGPAEALLLPACGHSPHRDRPDETLAAVAAFVARVSAPAGRESASASGRCCN